MKIFLLCIFLLFAFSCSPDEASSNAGIRGNAVSQYAMPANADNPFDQEGVEYYTRLNQFRATHGYPDTQQEQITQLLFVAAKPAANDYAAKSVITITPEMISGILANPMLRLAELIDNSTLSTGIKTNLGDFVSDLVDRQNDDYDAVYSFIVAYETAVVTDALLQEDEKDTILKVSSISRYSLYEEARDRDRDWETSVTNKKTEQKTPPGEHTIIALAVLFDTLH